MSVDSERVEESSDYLLVRSGGYRCAIPVDAAKLVTKAPELIPLPGSAPRFLGLAQIVGEPVAVVDLHALLDPGGDPGGGHELTVIIRRPGGGSSLGLAVDEAFGVVDLSADEPTTDADPEWVTGRTDADGRPVVILDPKRLFADPMSVEKGASDAG